MSRKRLEYQASQIVGPFSRPGVEPALVAFGLSLIIVVANLRGADYPAQYFRATIYRSDGFTIWNNAWYSGHFTPSYSLIAPALSAWFGPVAVAVGSSVAASFFFGRLARRSGRPLARSASIVFACSTIPNVLIGRTAFALGLAVGLWALDAWFNGRRRLAIVLALVAGLSTPVASVFLGLATGAIALDEAVSGGRRFAPRLLSSLFWITTVVPLGAFAVAFGSDGVFHYEPAALALTLAGAIGVVATTDHRTVRLGAAAAGVAAVLFFMVENPMGGNFQRFPMLFAGTAALLFCRSNHKSIGMAMAAVFLGWSVFPAAKAAADAYGDPSRNEAYFTPLINYINWHGDHNSRVEIPFTLNHWESHYVAREFPLARGWERQSDREVNPLLYDKNLTAEAYHQWLLDRAVRWVALPDVALDNGGAIEAELLATDYDWLTLVWETEHWTVWEVEDSLPILSGPAELKHLGFDNIRIESAEAGPSILRIRYMPYWTVEGPATIEATPDGLTKISFIHPGDVQLNARFELADLFGDN